MCGAEIASKRFETAAFRAENAELNLRVSFLAFGIGLKVSLFCLLAKLIQHTVGSWAFIFVAIYCFGTIAAPSAHLGSSLWS